MLGKLLKYEIKAMGRVMLPLYAVLLFASCLFAFNLRLNMSGTARLIVDRFAIVTGFLFAAAVLVAVVVMVIIVIMRFHKNLLGTEGYLMFTLPVRTHELILSKAISAFVWIAIGVAAGALSGFMMISITSSLNEFLRELRDLWVQFVPGKTVATLLWFILMLAAGVMESLIKVYAAISAGHQLRSYRLAGSVGAYVLFGVAEMLLTFLADKTGILKRALFSSDVLTVSAAQRGTLTALLLIAVYGFICWYLLDRRLNLE